MTVKEIEEKYLYYSDLHGDMNVNNIKANKSAKELVKLNTYMSNNLDIAKQVIDDILYTDKINAKIWITGLAIDINYKKQEVIDLLVSLSKDKTIGILAMNARGVLVIKKIISINDPF